MDITTYLFFDGCCEEAIQFYTECLGAETLFLMRYSEGPPNLIPPGGENLVFHATIKFGETTVNMSDLASHEHMAFGGFALLAHYETVERAEQVFEALQSGGRVKLPLAQSPWALRYGIVIDKFGVTWKVQVNV